MRRLSLLGCVIPFLVIPAQSQQLQWASKVIEFSSQLTEVQYSANQILGKPNVMPAGGQNPNAWTPDKPKRKEWIKVGFDRPIEIQQIAIAESYNPSGLYRLFLYDQVGKEYPIRTFNPVAIPLQGRMLNIMIEKTPYKVAAVKLEFDGAALPEYFSIDAVAITDAMYPVIAAIDRPELLASGIFVEKLDANVNSDKSELNPLLSPDGTVLYFSRQNHPKNAGGVKDPEDIWYSELGPDGKWSLAKNMGPEFNNEQPNFINSVTTATPDGKSVLLVLGNTYKKNEKMVGGISISDNIKGKWSTPKPLIIDNYYNFSDHAHYFLTNNRKALLMSVEREDTRGGRDLYVSFMKPDSAWTEPLDLGSVVNSAGDEVAPFLASDDETLYFSSNGFSGYGGNDIYMSKRLDDSWTKWSEPRNMGSDINSKGEDLFFNIPATSEYAYYSKGSTADNLDVFRAKLPLFIIPPPPLVTVRGKLIDAKTGLPIAAKIIYEQLPDGKELGTALSDPVTGEYEIKLPAGNLYGVRAEAEGHMSQNQSLDLRNFKADAVVTNRDMNMAPIEVVLVEPAATITLNNVFFDFDKSALKPESFPELDRVIELMNKQPSMQVEISGHADGIGPAGYNMALSKVRAGKVVEYLLGKGISGERVSLTYYGETRPIVDNKTESNRKRNRRVEFIILKM